jgi:hypothetical protein
LRSTCDAVEVDGAVRDPAGEQLISDPHLRLDAGESGTAGRCSMRA